MHHKKADNRLIKGLFYLKRFWDKGFWQKLLLLVLAFVLLSVSTMYGIARWYIAKHADEPREWGITFVQSHAEYLGLDPKDTMQAIIDDLGITKFRLVSHWDRMEKQPGVYDFSELDWQFEKVAEANGSVSLAIGLRQPRWPECHPPEWAKPMPKDEWYPRLKDFLQAVVSRYKDHPNLESYQLENEYFINIFGECHDYDRARLIDEFNFVKSLDSNTPIITTKSNNFLPNWPLRSPHPDIVAGQLYKKGWYKNYFRIYLHNPLPSWYYGFLAGLSEMATGKEFFIHEIQTEPWVPDAYALRDAPRSETDKTMSPELLRFMLNFGKETGTKKIYLWGGEWWYFRKSVKNDPVFWDIIKNEVESANQF